MKAIFTSLLILMMNFAFAQTPNYTLNDSKGNKYEVFGGYIKRTPVEVTNTIKKPGSTATTSYPEKSVEIMKATADDLARYFEAVIAATADHVSLSTSPTITYLVDSEIKKIHVKASATTLVSLQKQLENLLAN